MDTFVKRFKIKLARTIDQQSLAASIRERAYKHHLPSLSDILANTDPIDLDRETVQLYCEDSLGDPVGSLRFTGNKYRKLPLANSTLLPSTISEVNAAEITRLVVPPNSQSRYIKSLLFKSVYLYCVALQVKTIVAGARFPLDIEYQKLGFVEIFPGLGYVPIAHTGGIPHKILCCDVPSLNTKWRLENHPSYSFLFETFHEEIKIFDSVSSSLAMPRTLKNNQFELENRNLSDLEPLSSSQ